MAVPVGPVEAESVSVVPASAGVTGMAIISKDRTTAAARTLKNLLRFICHLPQFFGTVHNTTIPLTNYNEKSKER